MRLFGTAALLVVALAASQSAAQNYEQAIQFTRAEPQDGSFRGRNLGRNKRKKKRKNNQDEEEEVEKETRQGNPSCSVCGDGMQVGNPDAVVSFPGQSGQIPCGILESMGTVGLIPEPQCKVLPQLISSICECESIVSTSTMPTETTTTEATKKPGPGSGSAKAGKSTQLSHSMSVPAKAGKSFYGKSTAQKSSGKSNKAVISTKGSKMFASKASSKAEKSASKSSKSSSTVDAKAEKVTG